MVKIKGTKGQTMIYKTLHRKLKIEQHALLDWIFTSCSVHILILEVMINRLPLLSYQFS